MARSRKMATVARTGSRLEQLKNLAGILAKQIDLGEENKDGLKTLPQLSKQYRDTIKEIEEIEGADRNDDEIGEILTARTADGKSGAVR